MNVLRKLVAAVLRFFRILLYEWIPALRYLLTQLASLIAGWLRRRSVPDRERRVSDADCVPINEEAMRRPDPLLYSQTELMNLGLAVTWDNPDVQLFHTGSPVPSSELDPDTEYDVVARVWNRSTTCPVVGLRVAFSMLSFGIGTTSQFIDRTSIPLLGVKGGPSHPAFATIKWRTPPVVGHYCLQVLLEPVDDLNFGNNLGAENTHVGLANSPAEFTFELRNPTAIVQTYRFELDAYRLAEPTPCDDEGHRRPKESEGPARVDGPEMPERPPAPAAAHDRANYPVPEGWSVELTPPDPRLEPGGSTRVAVRITPPIGYSGRQAINVNAFGDLGFAGGVTLHVDAP